MNDEILDEEFSIMYEESNQPKGLDSSTFKKPIKHIPVKKPVTMSPDNSVRQAIEEMQKKRIGCILVTEKSKIVGIFTERDVLLKIAAKRGMEEKKLREVMTPKVSGFQPDDSIAFVLNAMHVGGYRHVPVIDEHGTPVAVISVKDIISFLLDHFPEDILNLPPSPVRRTDQREGA
ncbi:MAG TPA: CBS domain-containing protein [Bacteroidota bacterium]|nr:CBS domain-containing protein [Bacteroidota bacterium]